MEYRIVDKDVSNSLKGIAAVLSFLGGISYEIYIWHQCVALWLNQCTNMNPYLRVFLVVIFTVVLAVLMNKVNKKLSEICVKVR